MTSMGAHNKGQENRVAIFSAPWYHNKGIQMCTVEVRYEQSSKKEHPVCPGRTCADWLCHVGALGQPEHSAPRWMGVSAQRDLSFSVQRMGILHSSAYCADPGAAVSSGNFRADGAVAAAALHQVCHESGGAFTDICGMGIIFPCCLFQPCLCFWSCPWDTQKITGLPAGPGQCIFWQGDYSFWY